MDSERWRRVERVYHSVLAYPSERRAAVLEESCSGDPDLLRELKSLLEAREQAGTFLSPQQLHNHIAELGSEPPGSFAGTSLGHYQILAEIGAGSMGEVYRARDNRLDRELVLKILPPRLTHDAVRISRLRLEAKAAAALNHPNIVTVYEIGQVGDIWYIAEELIEGITLRERLAGGKLPLTEALDIAIQCGAALQTAHRSGILHRDIKPENIMLRSDDLVKMVDFGLARFAEAAPGCAVQTTQPGSIMGTPRYMSPEQARGQKLDARSDVFSLGAVLYEMVAGRPAFPGATPADVFAMLLGTEPLPTPPKFGTQLDQVLSKALERDRETRYQSMQEFANDLKSVDPLQRLSLAKSRMAAGIGTARGVRQAALAVSALLLAGIAFFFFLRYQPALTAKDSILLADFTNETGEPVFDGTLKQGLAVQLEQSPMLNIFPDAEVRRTLQMMGQSPNDRVSGATAREICQREGVKALVAGSITPLGRHYVLALEAVDSRTGNNLARAQVEATGKEQVLQALTQAASQLRRNLGEPLRSLRKFDALLERTTSSLEALQAYSLGYQERRKGRFLQAVPLFQRAVELDPNFAYAYAELATLYYNTGQRELAASYTAKAYMLRERTSEREKLHITSLYHDWVTGDDGKALEALQLYAQIYPRDVMPHTNLSTLYARMGQFEQSVEEGRIALRLDPNSAVRFGRLGLSLIHLNRFEEAAAICRQAVKHHLEDTVIHHSLYRLAFRIQDRAAMEEQLQWIRTQPDAYVAMDWEARRAAYSGQWRRSAEYARDGIEGARDAKVDEPASTFAGDAALRSAVLGHCTDGLASASQSLSIERTRVSLFRAALARTLCGESSQAQLLMEELTSRYSSNATVNWRYFPVLRAALELNRDDAASAVEALRPASRYEAAAEFWPQYLRGQAYLRLRKGPEGAAEFRKILAHRGQGVDSVLYPLAHLGLARAATLERDTAQARKSYKDFLKEWNDADTDLPQLLAARQELDKLKSTP
jgi:serine/threonine protein kinase/Flp pilus assembly protein TadD